MDRVWESRENSLTEPQWDNRGRPDKDVWGGGGLFTAAFEILTFSTH